MESLAESSGIPVAGLFGVGLLILVQLTVQVTALVQLVKTPQERVTIGGRKWLWAIIILFGEIVGAVVWFAAGRKAAPVQDVVVPGAGASTGAADALYGTPKNPE